jgi:YD repeat-containing protein
VTYHYDPAGRFTGATETIDNTTREYDASGRVTRTYVRDGRKVVVFDADGRVIQHGGAR